MRTVRFVTASKANKEQFKTRPIFKSVAGKFDLYARLDNREGLSEVYNRFLNGDFEAFSFFGESKGVLGPADIIVFVHDDVEIVGGNVAEELTKWAEKGFSMMGLAGAAHVTVGEPALWNRMAPPQFHSGTAIFHISHRISPTERRMIPDFPYAATFGALREVDVLDGVFLAITLEAVQKTGFRFDEDFTFHHYDLAACLTARKAGLLLRTVFIPVIHMSPGINKFMEDKAWLESQAKFLEKYGGR